MTIAVDYTEHKAKIAVLEARISELEHILFRLTLTLSRSNIEAIYSAAARAYNENLS